MNKILCIVGPTGTGKTNLAVKLHKQIPSVLISADSRQVYRGMDIVTGKDHPSGIQIHGLDLVDPGESCSVSVWFDSVAPVLKQAWENHLLPIIVGGTGLYISALKSGIPTMQVPLNKSLRTQLSKLSVTELQNQLSTLGSSKYASLNQSDQFNPRRLIRAIEVASHQNKVPNLAKQSSELLCMQSKLIGLHYSDQSIQRNKIYERVVSRLSLGAITETQRLLKVASPQSLSAIGYRSIIRFLNHEITESQMIDSWTQDELSYVKRQLTYFRKLGVIWYDRSVVTDEEIIYDILQGRN